jgi:hypothetical protein
LVVIPIHLEVAMRTLVGLLTFSLIALVARFGGAQYIPGPIALPGSNGATSSVPWSVAAAENAGKTQDEIQRLRSELAELRAEIQQLRQALNQSRARAADSARTWSAAVNPVIGDPFQAAKKALGEYKQQRKAVCGEARPKIRELRARIAAELKKIEERYCREARLDEAVAVRNCIARLQTPHVQALPDPGILRVDSSTPQVLYFCVTGSDSAPVWGTDVYTADASVAAAAVHAGVLKAGQTGIVKVTSIPNYPSFAGSVRNGIQSSSYGSYTGFTVELAGDEQPCDADEEQIEIKLPSERPAAAPAASQTPMSPSVSGATIYLLAEPVGLSSVAVPGTQQVEVRGAASADVSPLATDADLPPDAREVLDQWRRDSEAICKEASRKTNTLRRATIQALTPLKDALTRAGRLDEAIAVRDCIRALMEGGLKIEPDPGSLAGQNLAPGAVRYFRVTGEAAGSVWGTDIYTSDSRLAAAAVHAGLLRPGESGVVKVAILPGQSSYAGSDRHGLASMSYGPFPSSYRMSRVSDVESYDRDK